MPHLHIVSYLDGLMLSSCWLPFMGEGALFVPAQPVSPCLETTIPLQVLLLRLPNSETYCLSAHIFMILPPGTGPARRGGYLMLLEKPAKAFLSAMENICGNDVEKASPGSAPQEKHRFNNLPEWLHHCAGNHSTHTLQ